MIFDDGKEWKIGHQKATCFIFDTFYPEIHLFPPSQQINP